MARAIQNPIISLGQLSDVELGGLRLAVQVLAHKAAIAGFTRVALYFESLESAAMAEQAARAQSASTRSAPLPGTLSIGSGADDRRLVVEYLHLLVDNERLSAQVRSLCRMLASRARLDA